MDRAARVPGGRGCPMRGWFVVLFLSMAACGGEEPPELANRQCTPQDGTCPATLCCGTGDDGLMDCYLERPDGAFYLCEGADCSTATVDMACAECDVCA